jgi:hypothetical protein
MKIWKYASCVVVRVHDLELFDCAGIQVRTHFPPPHPSPRRGSERRVPFPGLDSRSVACMHAVAHVERSRGGVPERAHGEEAAGHRGEPLRRVRAAAPLRARLLLPLLQGNVTTLRSLIAIRKARVVVASGFPIRRASLTRSANAGEASGGERAWPEVRDTRDSQAGHYSCWRRRGCRRDRVAEREAESVVVGCGWAELRRVVPEAEPETARAGPGAVLLREPEACGPDVFPPAALCLPVFVGFPQLHGNFDGMVSKTSAFGKFVRKLELVEFFDSLQHGLLPCLAPAIRAGV